MEIFDGNGGAVYIKTLAIPEGAEVCCYINGKVDFDAVIEGDTITFSKPVDEKSKCAIEYYIDGGFTANFDNKAGNMNKGSLSKRIIEILARACVVAWADKEQNFMLDIRNLLNDTDFKLHSPANALKSKIEWVESLRYEIYSLQTKLDWDYRNINTSYYSY